MGGKRKKSNNGPLKKESKYKIPSRFDCPLCDAKSSIAVKIIRSTGEAVIYCRTCKVGLGRRWPILPLEKAVDVFFRFREELMQLDRAYLDGQRLDGGDGASASMGSGPGAAATMQVPTSRNGVQARSLTELSRARPPSAVPAATPSASHTAGAVVVGQKLQALQTNTIDLGEDGDNAAHFFAPPEPSEEEGDDYAAMFE